MAPLYHRQCLLSMYSPGSRPKGWENTGPQTAMYRDAGNGRADVQKSKE